MSSNKLPVFLMGFGIGSAVGLLLTPKPGVEAREDLRRGIKEGREYLEDQSGEWRELSKEILEQGKQTVQANREKLNSAFKAGVQAYDEAVSSNS